MKELLFNAKMVMTRSRYPWVDYCRGICILLVCYRHVFEGLSFVGEGSYSYPMLKYSNIFFFSFRMPLFFMISGMFIGAALSRKGIKEYVDKRFNTIFFPLLVWGTIHITLQLLFKGYVNAQREPIDYLNLIINPRRIEQFWYLNALFFVGVLYALITVYGKFKTMHQLILGLIFYAIAAYLFQLNIQIGFLFDVLFFYLFFAIGDLMSKFVLNARNYKMFSSPITFMVIVPVFIFVQHYFTELNLGQTDDYYVQYNLPALFALAALIGGAFIINVSFLLEKFDILRFLRVIGYHSLYIYVMHLMITSFTRIALVRILNYDNVIGIMIISIILGILIPIIIYNLASRLGAWWLFAPRKTALATELEKTRVNYSVGMVSPKESAEDEKK